MRSPLEKRIGSLRGRVRRLLALHGTSWVVAGLVLTVLAAGLLDWLFHLSREVRLGLLLATVGLTGWLLAKCVIAPLVLRFRDLDIALRIEERWPGLQDRLATTVQFLALKARPDDREDIHGSRQLREETIRRTLSEAESIDFREVVDPRPARKAMATAAVPVALGLALLAAAPESCRLALARLFAPFGSAQWPKQTHLVVLEPHRDGQKVAQGEPFRLEVGVAEGEALPNSGEVTYDFDDGETLTRRLGTQLGKDGSAGGAARFVDRMPEVTRSFRYRVAAGDDLTPTRSVVAVPPPSLSFARVKLAPPEYTGEPKGVVEPGGGKDLAGSEFDLERIVVGTTVELEARANKPLAEASLNLLGSAPWARDEGRGPAAAPGDRPRSAEAPAVTLRDGGRRIVASFTVEGSGAFGFDLRDTEGFRGQARHQVRFNVHAIPDNAPQVAIEEPPGNRDVTANAVVPVVIESEDDFGLGKVWLEYSIAYGGSEPERRDPLVLWVADEEGARPTRKRQVRFSWDLASPDLALDLKPGAVVTFHAAATDLDTLRGPKQGKSRELQLRILEPEKIAEQLEDQRRQIREEIARTLTMQKQAITPVEEARRTLRQVDRLEPEDRENVRNAEAVQRQVTGRVNDPSEGLHEKVERYLRDQDNLKIDNAEAREQMQRLLASLDRIRDDHLVPAEQGLSRANKSLDESSRGQPPRDSQSRDRQGESPQPKGREASRSEDASRPGEAQSGEPAETKAGEQAKAQAGEASKSRAGEQTKSGEGQSQPREGEPTQAQAGEPPQGGEQTDARKPEDEPTRAGQELALAEREQRAIADELQGMLDQLNEFETMRGVLQEAKGLLKQQQETMKATAEANEKGALDGKTPDQLPPQARAALENLGERQKKLADDLSQFQNKLDEMARRTEQEDPIASQAMKDASADSRNRDTSGKAQEAGEQLAQNQMGRAQEGQKQVERDLKKLVDSLDSRRENDLRRLVQALKDAEQQMEDLRRQQAMNRLKTEEAKAIQDEQQRQAELEKLAKEQKQIEEQLKRQLEKLRKLAVDAQRPGSRAASRMSKASQQQQEDDADEAMQEQDEALANLEDVQDQIEDARRDAEEQLAMEQLSRIRDDLANLGKRQAELVVDVEGYDKLRVDGALTLPQKKSVVGLGRAEESVRDETSDLVERLDAAPVYARTLEQAADAMSDASKRLRAADPGESTLRDMRLASRRFDQLLEALQPDKGEGGNQGGDQEGGGDGPRGGDGIPTVAQLKMLRILQEEINERTDEIAEIRERKNALTPDQETELARLQDEQRNVADLARDLTRPRRDDGEE